MHGNEFIGCLWLMMSGSWRKMLMTSVSAASTPAVLGKYLDWRSVIYVTSEFIMQPKYAVHFAVSGNIRKHVELNSDKDKRWWVYNVQNYCCQERNV